MSMDDLFDLVKSLNKAEKRYFKMMSKVFKETSEHIRLFDFLEKSKSWYSGLLENFESGYSGNQAALKKRYLKEQIFNSLRSYHKKQTATSVILILIQDIEILYHKRLFQQCAKTVSKAKRIAGNHERFGLYLELLGWERRLIASTLDTYNITETTISKEEDVIHAQYRNVVWAKQLQSKVFEFKKKNGFLKSGQIKELNALVSKDEIENAPQLLSKRASFYFLWAQSIYFWMLSDHEKSYATSNKISKVYSDVVNPEDYFFGLLEHITACICTHRYEEVLARLIDLEGLIEKEVFGNYPAIRERFLYYQENYSLIANVILGRKEPLKKFVNQVVERLEREKENNMSQIRQVLNSTLGHVYFVLEDYEQSKNLYWSILNVSKGDLRRDILDNAKLFYLFILYEMRKYDLLEFELDSSYKYFNQNRKRYTYELNMIKKLMKVSDFSSNTEREHFAHEVLKQMQSKIENNKNADHFEDYLLLFWANSVIKNTSCLKESSDWYSSFTEKRKLMKVP